MNIEKLAKHLKEFTLDEIEMIAECDCKTGLKQLLNANKIRIRGYINTMKLKKSISEFL